MRLCACMGVPMDVIGPCGFPASTKSLRRAAMDYADAAAPNYHTGWDEYLRARPEGRLVALSTGGTCDLWDFAFQPGDALVMGRETAGLPDAVLSGMDAVLRIPMPGGGRSLNVAMSAGIAVSEALRQLSRSPG